MNVFDLEKALAGSPVIRRDGGEIVSIRLSENLRNKSAYPIQAYTMLYGEMQWAGYTNEGWYYMNHSEPHLDLFMKD